MGQLNAQSNIGIASDLNLNEVPERQVLLGSHEVSFYKKNDRLYISPTTKLQEYPQKLTDRLLSYAQSQPEKIFAAKRNIHGEWDKLSYAETLKRAWPVAQALRNREILSVDRPLIILSGNDLEHLVLSMAAMLAGVPFSAISPAYSLIAKDFEKLKHVLNVLTPGMVFASDSERFADALKLCIDHCSHPVEIVTCSEEFAGLSCTSLKELIDTPIQDIQAHYERLDQHQIAKFLFTSGSTSAPKAVPTTHQMLCVNQQMLLQTFPEFAITAPVLVDWLSWHHTFGGSHNVGIALYNGGTIYIDDGKPVAGYFEQTIRNLKEISPTIYLNVPKGWEELTVALEQDAQLRNQFFSQVKILFFAGAALSATGWERLDRIAQQHCGERIRIMCGLGMTETAPSCTFSTGPHVMPGFIGHPAPGCEIKLSPTDGKLELCVKGPHVMQGYWRLDESKQDALFDEEGYYRTGDAVRLVDAEDPSLGLMYDGRIAEDFKLNTGTFINVGRLRNKALFLGHSFIHDICVTGSNLDAIGFLIFPKISECAAYVGASTQPNSMTDNDIKAILSHPDMRAWFEQFLSQFNQDATGSSNRVRMLYLMHIPARLDLGEITDKGNLNQAKVTSLRAHEIDALYDYTLQHPLIIRI